MQPASAGGSVRLAMSSVYATSKCMLDYYRKGNMARDEPQLVRAYGRKNFDPVIKEWKWPDFGNVTISFQCRWQLSAGRNRCSGHHRDLPA